ncbi:MAG: transporter related [Sphingomonas bacterium]|uniref:ABC transporter ATP-binding protein n=1 Tax=Sphingomonas bacterium TaxID=1895847 RepID=UPI002611B50D|nr:ABC transporter ATP-binding protein [Sphingomonas bacterium]MDB5710432.1 transporter related [Sphingomonas bacterium]
MLKSIVFGNNVKPTGNGMAISDKDRPAQPEAKQGGGLSIAALRSALAGPFDARFASGSTSVITGASGSGKSLLLRMIADLDPNNGAVALDERSRSAFTGPEWRRHVPYVAAESGWWADNVEEHFADDQGDAARALATRLGVGADKFSEPVARLSTGERQRLALVRALVLASPVLLLDEPTGPLDPESVAAVEALITERAASGTIVVMVSHDPNQSERLNAVRYHMANRQLERIA